MRCCFIQVILILCFCRGKAQNIDSLAEAAMAREDSSNIIVQRLKANSRFDDFSPLLFRQQLFFVSGRNEDFAVVYADQKGNTHINDIYQGMLNADGSVRSVRPAAHLNSKLHEGPLTISGGGDTVIYTTTDKKGRNALRMVTRKNGSWSRPAPLPFALDTITYCHPAFLPGDSALLFSSNAMGGEGKLDLYLTRWRNNGWSTPENVRHLNSDGNDVFPFVCKKGMIYFSSDRHGGKGGLDLYRADSVDGPAAPLPEPFNTERDDFGIWTDSTGTSGYFSSNRNGSTGDDIFRFSRRFPDFQSAGEPPVKTSYCYSFQEESTLMEKDTASLTYEWSFGDGKTARGLRSRHCYAKPGTYKVRLDVIEHHKDSMSSNVVQYELEVKPAQCLTLHCRDTAVAGAPHLVDGSLSSLKGHSIDRIIWSFGDGRYNEGRAVKHIFGSPGIYVVEMWVLATELKTSAQKKFRISKNVLVKAKPEE